MPPVARAPKFTEKLIVRHIDKVQVRRISLATFLVASISLAACGGGGQASAEGPFVVVSAPTEAASAASTSVSSSIQSDPLVEASAPAASFEPETGLAAKASAPATDMLVAYAPSSTGADAASLPIEATAVEGLLQVLKVAQGVQGTVDGARTSVVTIHVATSGSDTWLGTSNVPNAGRTDGPVKTIARAQALARLQLASMTKTPPLLPIRVLIGAGVYPLAAPLVFTPADSGTAAAPVSYEAATPGTVTISGGVELTQRNAATATTPAMFDSPTAGGARWLGGGQLYVNGKRAILARQPKAGQSWFVQRPVVLASEPVGELGREAFDPDSSAKAWLNQLSAADRSRAIVNVMHSWTTSQHRIADLPIGASPLRVSPRANWAFLSSGFSQRYFVENTAAALTAAGEWLWDVNGVRYIPRVGEPGTGLNAVMPVLEQVVIVRGDLSNGRWVENLTFRGLTFAHTRFLTPDAGFSDYQAALGASAAVQVDGARAINIDHCNFEHLGGHGVWFRQAVSESTVVGSTLTDLGAGGVLLGQPRQLATDRMATGINAVRGNIISETGKQLPGAVGIWLGQGFDNVIANNFIFNTSYTGISMGWNWSYADSASGRNRITDNLLANIGQAQISDVSAIYTLGRSPGSVISGNVIREVRAYAGYGPGPGLGAWGIYGDEGTSEVTVENNIVVGTDSGGYHLNIGRANIVRQNLFALGLSAEIRVTQAETVRPEVTFTDNLIVPKAAKPFDGFAQAPDVAYISNLVSNTALGAATADITKCGAGCSVTALSVTLSADPRGVGLLGADPTTSARFALVASRAGPTDLLNAGALLSLPVQAVAPISAVAPPLDFLFDISGAALGTQPPGIRYNPAGNTAALRLVANSNAPGGRCLEFNDAPSLANRYDPHAYAILNHNAGTSTGEFSLIVDSKADFLYEWRDNSSPYRVGPSLRITSAGIAVGGKIVAPIKIGEWTRLKVVAPLAQASGTWTLVVTDAAGITRTVTGLASGSSNWQKLNYVGFISNTNLVSTACLTGVKITNLTP